MEWVVGLAIGAFIYWLFVLRPGRLEFWRIAAKYPDAAYDYFISSDCWKVFVGELPDNYQTLASKAEWMGPFTLWVPKLGGAKIFVFGKASECDRSQDEFLQKLAVKRFAPKG